MQGRKQFDQKLFYAVSLDALVPDDHPVRQLSEAIDLRFLYEETKTFYSHEGRPSVDPVVLFKLYLVAYFFGIASERRLMKEVQVNLAYRWFVGYDLEEDLPDHSVLTKARARFPESLFAGIFARVLGLCRARGLISGDMHLVDSSLIHADASNESFSRCFPSVGDFIDGLDNGTTGGGDRKRSYAFDGTVDPKRMGRRREKPGMPSNRLLYLHPIGPVFQVLVRVRF